MEPVLRADRAAMTGRQIYDDGYFEAFLKGAQPILEQRLSEASSAVASAIVGAWRQAGSPTLAPARLPPGRIR